MNYILTLADEIAKRFRSAEITAVEAELALLDMGFHSIRFTPTIQANYLGIIYTLKGA